jgi:hypothetical protein
VNRRPVVSTRISSIGWEESEEGSGSGTMEVEFRSGHIYRYAAVPVNEYQAFLGASSPGRYLESNIIDRYEHTKVR